MSPDTLLSSYQDKLKGMVINHVWNGHGTAIILEIGKLTYPKKGGKLNNNPDGEYTIMIEWDWRLEVDRKILSGSGQETKEFMRTLNQLVGYEIIYLEVTGQIPEIKLKFSNGFILKSFMTYNDDPEWAIMNHTSSALPTLMVKEGRLSSE